MDNILILDTETTSLDRPYCYNLGYLIVSPDNQILCQHDFVIAQVWDNLPLFASAYYADKRPLYVNAMRGRKAEKIKWGFAMQQLKRDIKQFKVTSCYAYNSSFDDKTIQFNCDWFHTQNAIETIPIFDIRAYAHQWICDDKYLAFCEQQQLLTESGNYSTTAESVYRYITADADFEEAHTALADSIIENSILQYCFRKGATPATEYKIVYSFPRISTKPFKIKVDGQIIYDGEYIKKYVRNDTYSFTTPSRE